MFWLDYYLSAEPDNFLPPASFTLSELDPAGTLPDRVYSKTELLGYLSFGRQKCQAVIASMQPGDSRRFINAKKNYSLVEILFYKMRPIQHHAAQLNLLLRQGMVSPPSWVSRTAKPLC